jgi:two-component system CheB/CheR fusion protein
MGLHQLTQVSDYVRYMREYPDEADHVFKELLIGVTSFFRDPATWTQLGDEVFPALLAGHPDGGMLRAWVPGCSTGEEAYGIAMVFKEAVDRCATGQHHALQIFATDLDRDAIDRARVGLYAHGIAADVSDVRLRRFFVEEEGHRYRISKSIRDMVIFAPQNLVMDPPFTKLDLLSCRNLLIYLDPALQKKLLPLFHYSLCPGGFLVLGNAETVGPASDLFAPIGGKSRIYRRLDSAARSEPIEFPGVHKSRQSPNPGVAAPPPATAPNIAALADQLLLRRHTPAAVLVNDQGEIQYFSGRTRQYLEPAQGRASLKLMDMAGESMGRSLRDACQRATQLKSTVTVDTELSVDGGTRPVRATVQALTQPAELSGLLLVVFADRADPGTETGAETADAGRAAMLARELVQTQGELRTSREEMQTSLEELKSTNEELQSMNEELQSTNEELTTSKEEIQSMNEELQTVNHELQAKVDELGRASDDMRNLLESTQIASVFLDDALNVRRYTQQAAHIVKLIASDVGRPITDMAIAADYPALADDARDVLRALAPKETQVATRDGRSYRVRVMPYQTQDKRIDGVVITFIDVTDATSRAAAMDSAHMALQQRHALQGSDLARARDELSAEIARRDAPGGKTHGGTSDN